MGHRFQKPLQEEVVDVHPHVGMVERDGGRSGVAQGGLVDGVPVSALVEEARPTLLQEREERVAVGDDVAERPGRERRVAGQQPEQVIVDQRRNAEPAVVPAQQEAEQVGLLRDGLRRDPEDMAQDEAGGLPVAQGARRRLAGLRPVQGVEVAPLQRGYHRVAQVREQLAQAERDPPAGVQEIVGQRAQVGVCGAQHDGPAGVFAAVPARPIPRFIGEAEGDAVLHRHQLEPALGDLFEDGGVQQQPVGVGGDGEPGGGRGGELPQNRVAPARHAPAAPSTRTTITGARSGLASVSRSNSARHERSSAASCAKRWLRTAGSPSRPMARRRAAKE